MKKILILILPILLLANPSWFYNLKSKDKNEIIGYGINKELSQAKQNAMADIVKTMSVKVDTQMNIIKKDVNGKYSKDISSSVQTKAQAILSGVKVLKVEQLDGNWYVASSYDNSPLEIKLKKELPINPKQEVQNSYLKHTPLFKSLNKEIGLSLGYEIIRKNNLWQIKYKDIIFPISPSEFCQLFTTYATKEISIKANKSIYNQNDEMYFTIDLSTRGYVSILYVEHDGKVGVLLQNKLENSKFLYPDLKSEDTFKIVNPYNKTISELYVAIVSKEPLSFNEFENVSDTLLDESNYNFHKLLNKLSIHNFSTFTIKVKK